MSRKTKKLCFEWNSSHFAGRNLIHNDYCIVGLEIGKINPKLGSFYIKYENI